MSELIAPPPGADKRNPGALAGDTGAKQIKAGWMAETEASFTPLARQARRLSLGFGLPPATATVVAALAFGASR